MRDKSYLVLPRVLLLLVTLLLALISGCSQRDQVMSRDQVISVDEDDAEMTAAIAKARSELPQFWQIFEKRAHGESDFCLKVKITDKNGTEHFWVMDIVRKDGKTTGVINNDPNTVASVKLGDRIEVPEADITDWLYLRDDKMVGNYTKRALFKHMSTEEVEQHKKMLADP